MVNAACLCKHGSSTSLRTEYVAAGWLEQPTREVRPRPKGNHFNQLHDRLSGGLVDSIRPSIF